MAEDLRQAALDYHRAPKPGKLGIHATKRMTTQRDLSLAYSPGVAAACEEIEKDAPPASGTTPPAPTSWRSSATAAPCSGSAPSARWPRSPSWKERPSSSRGSPISTCSTWRSTRPTSTASWTPSRASSRHSARSTSRTSRRRNASRSSGASGSASTSRSSTTTSTAPPSASPRPRSTRSAVVGKDVGAVRAGVLGRRRRGDGLSRPAGRARHPARKHGGVRQQGGAAQRPRRPQRAEAALRARTPTARTLDEVIEGADIFLGLSGPGTLSPSMVETMGPRPIILALANPTPEIMPEGRARRAGGCDHRHRALRLSQPGQQRPLLPLHLPRRASTAARPRINTAMKLACVRAIADSRHGRIVRRGGGRPTATSR